MPTKSNNKKKKQLGMNPSAANYKLTKDILWNFILETNKNKCHQCGEEMSRETFSIEHIIPWLDSDDPKDKFFNMNNISFSHLKCNCAAARRPRNLKPEEKILALEKYKETKNSYQRKTYDKKKRRERYLKSK
jgi:hypothetical protein